MAFANKILASQEGLEAGLLRKNRLEYIETKTVLDLSLSPCF